MYFKIKVVIWFKVYRFIYDMLNILGLFIFVVFGDRNWIEVLR